MSRQSATRANAAEPGFTPHPSSLLQRKCAACGTHTPGGGSCTNCADESKGLKLQKKLSIGASNDPLEAEADRVADQVLARSPSPSVAHAPLGIQRYSSQASPEADTAPESVHRTLSGSGAPLESGLRQDMETRFGHDFSAVRVHSDGAAAQSARDVSASAYTVGNNIVFGAGQYAPGSGAGRHLLAHELTHVVQQGGPPVLQRKGGTPGGFFANIGRAFESFFTGSESDYDAATLAAYLTEIESTGSIVDDFDSDNKARAVVAKNLHKVKSLTVQRLLVEEMLSGAVGDDDENAILAVLNGMPPPDRETIGRIIGLDRFYDKFDGAELDALYGIFPALAINYPRKSKPLQIGNIAITTDFKAVLAVAVADQMAQVLADIASYKGSPVDPAMDTKVRALSPNGVGWLLFAITLHTANAAAAPGLNKAVAIDKLVARAFSPSVLPLTGARDRFVHEALETSGWLENALGGQLKAPGAANQVAIANIVNPLPASGVAGDPLKVADFTNRLTKALADFIKFVDPAKWSNVGTRSLPAFKVLGDLVQNEARVFFAPYANAAVGNIFSLQPPVHASSIIFDTVTMVPTLDQRLGYLRNRAEIVGRTDTANAAITDINIFSDTNFDPSRDDAELETVVVNLEGDATVRPVVDSLLQHTGQKSGSGASTKIGLVTEFNADRASACEDHWAGIDTLCHEVLHALVHPKFQASAANFKFPQVIREGFTEVLGVQLFNDHVVKKASSDAPYKATLETGVTGAPCPAPAVATIGYGAAGAGAEKIRTMVGDDNFRASYFLGRTDLAGLP